MPLVAILGFKLLNTEKKKKKKRKQKNKFK